MKLTRSRLGELIMVQRLAREEEESLASQSSTDDSSVTESSDRLDLSSVTSAMSTVFGSDSGKSASGSGSKRSLSKSPARSPARSPTSPGGKGSSSSFFPPFHRRQSSKNASATEEKPQTQQQEPYSRDKHLSRWLTVGTVIYKSVGLGLMDLVVGFEIVRLAKEKGLGNHIEGFSS